jgi:hypothetical protein
VAAIAVAAPVVVATAVAVTAVEAKAAVAKAVVVAAMAVAAKAGAAPVVAAMAAADTAAHSATDPHRDWENHAVPGRRPARRHRATNPVPDGRRKKQPRKAAGGVHSGLLGENAPAPA